MATATGFFDAARDYTAQEFARVLRAASSPGVVAGIGNNLAVTTGPGLGVTVDTGFVTILGDWLYTDTTTPLALLAADPSLPRIDRIIARLTISAKTVELTKLTGTANASPTAPNLTLGSDVYEVPLAQVTVAAGATSPSAFIDQRQFAGPTVHDIIAGHTASGLTAGQVLQALTATTFGWADAPMRALTNAVVNGEFNIWQRGTSFPSIVSPAYHADRWQWQNAGGTAAVTISRDTIPPTTGPNAVHTPYNLVLTVGTADASIATGDLYALYTSIEGFDYRALTNGFALSFWVRAHRTGIYCVSFGNRGANETYVAEYSVNVADLWEYKTVIVPTPPTAGTWDYATGIGLTLYFVLAAGTSWNAGVANTWNANGHEATANQINGVAATTDVFSLALVNVVPGATARPLAPRPVAEELVRCQRYYEVIGGGGAGSVIAQGYAAAGSALETTVWFRVTKGGTPTVTKNGTWAVTNSAAQPLVDGIGVDSCGLFVTATATAQTAFFNNTADDTLTVAWAPV